VSGEAEKRPFPCSSAVGADGRLVEIKPRWLFWGLGSPDGHWHELGRLFLLPTGFSGVYIVAMLGTNLAGSEVDFDYLMVRAR